MSARDRAVEHFAPAVCQDLGRYLDPGTRTDPSPAKRLAEIERARTPVPEPEGIAA